MGRRYGATLYKQSQRFGKQHGVTMCLYVVNYKFLGGDDTRLEESFAFLEEIIPPEKRTPLPKVYRRPR